MKNFKFKKLLLALAPIGAIAIATPIVLTSCSEVPVEFEKTLVKPDDTNSDTFEPTTKNGLYAKLKEAFEKSVPGQEEASIQGALTDYSGVTQDDVKDVINMWSFNKWKSSDTKDNATKLENPFASNIKMIKNDKRTNATKAASTPEKWDVEFEYNFGVGALAAYNEGKDEQIIVTRKYTITDTALTATPSFTATTTKFEINGKSYPSTNLRALYATDNSKSPLLKGIESFTNQAKLDFNVKNIAIEFFKTNKKLVGLTSWDESKISTHGTSIQLDSNDKTMLIANLTAIENNNQWNGLDKTTTKDNVLAAVRDNNKILKDSFKNLINGSDFYTGANTEIKVTSETESTNPNKISFVITLKKGSISNTLKMNIIYT